MKTIIYAHPWDGSYNHAILTSVVDGLKTKGEKYQVIDLYKDQFNPAYSKEELRLYSKGETTYPLVKEYQKKLKESAELIFIFPIWWYDVPAILKGFLDKVLLPNFAYLEDKEGNYWKPLLTNIKKATVITTAPSSKELISYAGNAIEGILINSALVSIGIPQEHMKWIHFPEVKQTTTEKRKEFLEQLPSLI